jgi:tricorn protease
MGLGKLVGQATGGQVIGTREIQLIDGSAFRTPRIGVTTHKGVNMDKEGVLPDIAVEAHPDQLAHGQDAQLERAVEVLTQDVVAWKKSRPPIDGSVGAATPGAGSRIIAEPGQRPEAAPLQKD